MRIAHALQMPVLQHGGVEVLVRTLIHDAPCGDEIFLVSTDDLELLSKHPISQRLAGHLRVPDGPLRKEWNPVLLSWLRDHKIDICHFHLSGTYGWKARSLHACPVTLVASGGTPTVTTNHQAMSFFGPDGPRRPFWRRCAAQARAWPGKAHQLHAVRWEACVSKHDLALSRRTFPGFSKKLIQLYHSRLDAGTPFDCGPREHTILNVATIAFRKGQHLLVEAFARVAADFPDWKLDLVGFPAEAACVEHIRSIIRGNTLEERILLHGAHSDPTSFYRKASIYVQPSLLEGLGLSLQEAMFHEIACIGSDCGGIPELINRPTVGELFPSGDVTALAERLSRLMADSASRRNLGTAARSSMLQRGMTRQAMCNNYRELYKKALECK